MDDKQSTHTTLMFSPQFLDSEPAIHQHLVEFASTADRWSFCVDRIDLGSPGETVWRDLSLYFRRVRHAIVTSDSTLADDESARPLYESHALRILLQSDRPKSQAVFWFEFDSQCVAVVGKIDLATRKLAEGHPIAVATTCEPISAFSDSIKGFFDQCRLDSEPAVTRKGFSNEALVLNSAQFHKQRERTIVAEPAIKHEAPAEFDDLHREFSHAKTHLVLQILKNDRSGLSHAEGLIPQCKDRGAFAFRRWDRLIGLYRCPDCIRVILVPRQRKWYDYLWLGLLLRTWVCPHCCTGYLRGII